MAKRSVSDEVQAVLADMAAKGIITFNQAPPNVAPPTAPANAPVIGMLSRPASEAPKVAANPALMVRGEPSGLKRSKWGNEYETVTYTYGVDTAGEPVKWSAFTAKVSKPTAVGEPVLVNAKGEPFMVGPSDDSFSVLAILPCKIGRARSVPVRVAAKDLPAALALMAPRPSYTITIAAAGTAGK